MSTQENLLVSIIIRTRDRPNLLKKALKSVFIQTYRPIEVIIVNDGGCKILLSDIKSILGDISFKYVELGENKGRSFAANKGISVAEGRFIGFLDDDDEFYMDHIHVLVKSLINNDYLVGYTDFETIEYAYDEEKTKYFIKNRYTSSEDFSNNKIILKNFIPLICLLFNRRVFDEFLFDEEFELFEDWDLLIRVSERYPFYHVRKVTAIYNRNLSNQITSEGRLHEEAYMKLVRKHIDKFNIETLFYNWQCLIKSDELNRDLQELQDCVEELNRIIRVKDESIEELRRKIIEKDEVIRSLSFKIREKERELTKRYVELTDVSHKLQQMQDSFSWQVAERFRKFINSVLPTGTNRRYYHDLLMKGLKVLMKQGVKPLLKSYLSKLELKRRFVSVCHNNKIYKDKDINRVKGLDIIIPVYNAYDEFVECIRSIRENTDLDLHRLVIIDDASTDIRIKKYLCKLRDEMVGSNLYLIFNDTNYGYTKSVNMGLGLSEKDVIILNSDVVVTPNWIEKLQRAAYVDSSIATVTPFSNNATICSIPVFCKNNTIPAGFDVCSFSEFIDKISLRYYPEIPTGVGFCMYVKRKILNEIGFFDENLFNGGYGSENDFCWKAVKRGYRNVLDDSTFVYHKGGASFGREKKLQGEKVALDMICKVHPDYIPNVNRFIKENPLSFIHEYLNIRLKIQESI